MFWLAVALGGAVGAMARVGLAVGLARASGGWPWATLLANVLGAGLMGLLYVIVVERGGVGPHWRPLLMAGGLGAFTTFSTFALESLLLVSSRGWLAAAGYVLITNALVLAAVTAGVGLGRAS